MWILFEIQNSKTVGRILGKHIPKFIWLHRCWFFLNTQSANAFCGTLTDPVCYLQWVHGIMPADTKWNLSLLPQIQVHIPAKTNGQISEGEILHQRSEGVWGKQCSGDYCSLCCVCALGLCRHAAMGCQLGVATLHFSWYCCNGCDTNIRTEPLLILQSASLLLVSIFHIFTDFKISFLKCHQDVIINCCCV